MRAIRAAERSLAGAIPPVRAESRRALACGTAQQLDRASALLAVAALADSGVEHYRGSFHNKVMYVPLGVAALILASSLRGAAAREPGPRPRRNIVNGLAVATGVIGTGFHCYNIAKRPGGVSWLNVFYAAPLGAPAALSLAGLFGMAAESLRDGRSEASGRALAGVVSAGLIGTTAEAALMHFRGAYHNPAMAIPVAAPPVAAALLARAAISPRRRRHFVTRWALKLLAAVGFIGSAFHAYGIKRNMGGWRNWTQNLLNGPPLPAPPSFTALAMAGLAALGLIERTNR